MKAFEYILKNHARSKGIKISIKNDGNIVVTKSRYISKKQADIFVNQNQNWINTNLENIKLKPKIQTQKLTKEDYENYKIKALKIIKEKLLFYNQYYNFPYKKITIKKQKTRWGSCSRKGNLNFNYKIAIISERLAEYIIVHELCHIGEFNHSYKFWNLIAETMPDYADRVKELKGIKL